MPANNPFNELDPLLQHKLRLGACVLLSKTESLSFSKLKETLGATDGNLGAQLTKLEDNGYLSVTKEFIKKKPVTWYSMTKSGRKAMNKHLDALQKILSVRESASSPTPAPSSAKLIPKNA